MTPDELAAIRARRRKMFILSDAEQDALLAEVDRLTLATMSENDYLNGQRHERARILAEVRAVEWVGCGGWGCATRAGEIYDAVIAAIEGDTT